MDDSTSIKMTHPLDLLNQSDYKSAGDYVAAAAELQLKRETPEFRAAYNGMLSEYGKRRLAAVKEQQKEAYAEIVRNTKLTAAEETDVKEQAYRQAQGDLTTGKITELDLADRISKYESELTTQAINKKAGRSQANELFRKFF